MIVGRNASGYTCRPLISPSLPPRRSVAPGDTGVAKGLAFHRDKLPIVSLRVQGKFEHAVGVVVVDLRVGDGKRDLIEAPTPCAHHELPDAILGIRPSLRILRGKTLVVVVVSVEHHVDASGEEDLPKTLHSFYTGTIRSRSEQRVVEVDKGTHLFVVGGEVLFEPTPLGGAGTAADLSLSTVAVEGDEVPASQVVGVVPFAGIASRCAEVVEVA